LFLAKSGAQSAEPIVVSISENNQFFLLVSLYTCISVFLLHPIPQNVPLTNTFHIQGATIKTDEETGKIVIARVMHGGAADRSGLIHVGDEVVEVNYINVEGKTPNDVLNILVRFGTLCDVEVLCDCF
jgi:predicted metalloprotease with PDZ domain